MLSGILHLFLIPFGYESDFELDWTIKMFLDNKENK
jgi:hypothetical protein